VKLKLNPADLELCGLQLDSEILERTEIYMDLLLKWSKKINLTAVEDRDELLRFHLLEAYWAANCFRRRLNCFVDIGSGAGFPGMAMKIILPAFSRATLVEPNFKKVMFLQTLRSSLDLDVEIFHGKAESFTSWREYETATVRALKPSSDILANLRKNRLPILVFRGGTNPIEEKEWIIAEEYRFPLSKNRYVSAMKFDSDGLTDSH
jgi:16S rRNA (guanine(527)-N(7))-methyltransferase RsmG